jgi:hypothetical protein
MEPVVGVFANNSHAQDAVESLREKGIAQVTLLMPGEPKQEIEGAVPTEDMEQPGIGPAIGGVIGGAVGIAGGMELGAVAASFIIPGVGPVMAAGFLGDRAARCGRRCRRRGRGTRIRDIDGRRLA